MCIVFFIACYRKVYLNCFDLISFAFSYNDNADNCNMDGLNCSKPERIDSSIVVELP